MAASEEAARQEALASADRAVVGEPDIVRYVALAQEGSAHAFAALYDRYVDDVHSFVYHRVGHRQTAEDLVGDVFLRALARIRSFEWQGVDFGAWLTTIARNRVHDHFKSARFRLDVTVEEVFDEPRRSPDDPEAAVIRDDLARQVHEALGKMKSDQAEVLYLRFIRHLSVAETAVVMARSVGAVKALQYRALKSLADEVPEDLSP